MGEQDIDILYRKVNNLNEKTAEISATLPFFKEMITKNAESTERLVTALQEIQNTMICISNRLEDQSKDYNEMREKLTSNEIELRQRLSELEEKGHFDIHLFIKEKWPYILVILGIGMMYISKVVKF